MTEQRLLHCQPMQPLGMRAIKYCCMILLLFLAFEEGRVLLRDCENKKRV